MRPVILAVWLLACLCGEVCASAIWPAPRNQTLSNKVLFLSPSNFQFRSKGFSSSILDQAFDRYSALLFETPAETPSSRQQLERVRRAGSEVRTLDVYVASTDQSLGLHTAEGYTLQISSPHSSIEAASVFGALHGLESFSQLVERVDLGTGLAAEGLHSQRRLSAAAEGSRGDDAVDLPGQQTLEAQDAEGLDAEAGKEADLQRHRARHRGHKERRHRHQGAGGGRGHKKHSKHRHHKHRETSMWIVNATSVWDEPRFKHRGLLLDTARHFLPVPLIKEHLDAMAWAKMNVFHWHIVDDQSFPLALERLPLLPLLGAFSPAQVYTADDVAEVVDYARARGIRVLPEIDTPGHTLSWGRGYPELLTSCYTNGEPNGQLGPLNPASNGTYEALWALFRETASLFPDSYLHLGGDEVPFDCWESNPTVKDYMKAAGLGDMPALEADFEERVLQLAEAAGRSYIIWQDVVDNGVKVRDDTVVHVWKWWWPVLAQDGGLGETSEPEAAEGSQALAEASGLSWWEAAAQRLHIVSEQLQMPFRTLPSDEELVKAAQQQGLLVTQTLPAAATVGLGRELSTSSRRSAARQQQQRQPSGGSCQLSRGCQPGSPADASSSNDAPGWTHEMARITAQGYKALLSSPWYLNLGSIGVEDWREYYAVEPQDFGGNATQQALVMGGEACVWGEFVDQTNSIARTWPRAAAVAERLWSDAGTRDVEDARKRLVTHRCRMLARGIGAEPIGPGFCHGDQV